MEASRHLVGGIVDLAHARAPDTQVTRRQVRGVMARGTVLGTVPAVRSTLTGDLGHAQETDTAGSVVIADIATTVLDLLVTGHILGMLIGLINMEGDAQTNRVTRAGPDIQAGVKGQQHASGHPSRQPSGYKSTDMPPPPVPRPRKSRVAGAADVGADTRPPTVDLPAPKKRRTLIPSPYPSQDDEPLEEEPGPTVPVAEPAKPRSALQRKPGHPAAGTPPASQYLPPPPPPQTKDINGTNMRPNATRPPVDTQIPAASQIGPNDVTNAARQPFTGSQMPVVVDPTSPLSNAVQPKPVILENLACFERYPTVDEITAAMGFPSDKRLWGKIGRAKVAAIEDRLKLGHEDFFEDFDWATFAWLSTKNLSEPKGRRRRPIDVPPPPPPPPPPPAPPRPTQNSFQAINAPRAKGAPVDTSSFEGTTPPHPSASSIGTSITVQPRVRR
ncbi:hypothetical protein BJ508DRAFT_335874 [Ascobolus immersus RN42]|uniref:Uncharacterized protein n=1 Tax=Ascobolus immersus RN42 TaxID=1160509 RepID=A0A3N4HAP6_ASCIM|nr:hypothetical protein BJ508DRAFT_335874 [Ascobolus immersus RN42]